MKNEILDNIATHLEDKNSKLAITQLVSALDARRDLKLPAVLQEKLDLVKTNPLEAKEIKTKQDEIEKMLESKELDADEAPIELLEAILTKEELIKFHDDGVSLAEFQKLGVEIGQKVFSFKYLDENENYIYKEIDSHRKMSVLSFFERKEIRKLSKKNKNLATNIFQKLQEARGLVGDDSEESAKKVKSLLLEIKDLQAKSETAVKELNNKAMEYSKLDKKDMKEWEQNLAIAKVIEMAEDKYTPPLGKN